MSYISRGTRGLGVWGVGGWRGVVFSTAQNSEKRVRVSRRGDMLLHLRATNVSVSHPDKQLHSSQNIKDLWYQLFCEGGGVTEFRNTTQVWSVSSYLCVCVQAPCLCLTLPSATTDLPEACSLTQPVEPLLFDQLHDLGLDFLPQLPAEKSTHTHTHK